MLLSIDRVLKLLAEGKTIGKIAELANCEVENVAEVIEQARKIINKHEKPLARKKIIIRKSSDTANKNNGMGEEDQREIDDLLDGAELSSVPVDSSLTMYIDGASKGNPGPAGIGIVIFDKDDRQVGKISAHIGMGTNNHAEYIAFIRALKIANYFKAKVCKIRTDSELIVKQISGEYQVKNENIKKLYNKAIKLMEDLESCKVEHVSRQFNEKADYLAKKASSRTR